MSGDALLGSVVTTVYIDVVDGSGVDLETLGELASVTMVTDESDAIARLANGESDGYICGEKYVTEGTDPTISMMVRRVYTQNAIQEKLAALPPQVAELAKSFNNGVPAEILPERMPRLLP